MITLRPPKSSPEWGSSTLASPPNLARERLRHDQQEEASLQASGAEQEEKRQEQNVALTHLGNNISHSLDDLPTPENPYKKLQPTQ